jgi:hypothetical protein
MLIGSAGLKWITETEISDGKGGKKIVRICDKVDLLQFDETVAAKDPERDYMAKHSYDLQKNHLGKGPYEITRIGHWPCGRIMLYIKTATSSGTGVYTDDFVAV